MADAPTPCVQAGPTVSVVIPCYNAAHFLGMALDSVVGQSRPPEQVLVIDDGSDDGTADVARTHGPGVRYFRQVNQGISAARNLGIAHAVGELIAFLDADDVWPCDSLARRHAALAGDTGLGCVFGAVEQFSSDGRAWPPSRPGRLAGAMLARRAVFDRVGLFDPGLRIGETIDWMARLEESGVAWRMVDEVVLRRRIHATNTVRDPAKQADYLKALRAALHRRREATRTA